jgi:hypothetical protein
MRSNRKGHRKPSRIKKGWRMLMRLPAMFSQDVPQGLRRACAFVLAVITILMLPRAAMGQNAQEQIRQEIARIYKAAEAMPQSNPNWKEMKPRITSSLVQARSSLEHGRLYSALEHLARAQGSLLGGQSLMAGPAVQLRGMKGFEAERSRVDVDLRTLEQRYTESSWSSKPLALRALAETGWTKTRTLFDSARAFATSTEPQDGLFYLGEAKASVSYALLCQSLNLKTSLAAPALHTMAPEIHRLEVKIIDIYKPPLSIEHHPEFIRIHAALKEAGDLDSQHLYAGALFKYLDSLQMLAALEAAPPGPERANVLPKQIAEARERVEDGKSDNSIAEIFLQRAEGGLDPNQSTADYARGWDEAQVIVGQVIPAYFAALKEVNEPTAPPQGAITVTLVRWPYT